MFAGCIWWGEAEEGVQPGWWRVLAGGCPVASCHSRPRHIGPSPRCCHRVWPCRGVSGGLSPCAASEQPEQRPVLSPPLPQLPVPHCCLSEIPLIRAQVSALLCPFGMGWSSHIPVLRIPGLSLELEHK